MLKRFLSILALQLFFLSSMVTGNGIAIENRSGKYPSSEVNKNPSETDEPKTASLLQQIISPRHLKGNKEHKNKYSSKPFQGESADAHNELHMKTKREFIREKDGEEPGACGKVDMMVSSSDLGLSDSFVYPERYNAFQCKGNCDLKQPHKFINHSMMKALLNSKNKDNTTDGIEACCVPIKFRSMSLLHLSDDDSIVLSTFNNMIVEECGCR